MQVGYHAIYAPEIYQKRSKARRTDLFGWLNSQLYNYGYQPILFILTVASFFPLLASHLSLCSTCLYIYIFLLSLSL